MKKSITIILLTVLSSSLFAQDTLTVMYYNLLNFPTSGAINRQDTMLPIFEYINPDVLFVNELTAQSGADAILVALNSFGAGDYQRATYVGNQSSTNNLQNMCFYRSGILSLQSQDEVLNDLRDINEYRLRYTEPGTGDVVDFDAYVAHLKAGNSGSDEARRLIAVDNLKAHFDASGEERLRIFGGDFNVYTSSDDSYQAALNTGTYNLEDPISSPGSWSNGSSYSSIHTQSTRTSSFGGGSTGGLDDRFDQILVSPNILSGTDKLRYVTGSYLAVGNDGGHFNQAINQGSNTSAPANVIEALHESSDHLPVIMQLIVDPSPDTTTMDTTTMDTTIVLGDPCSDLFFSEYIEGSSNNKALEIYNPTASTVDLSLYTVSAYNNGAVSPTNSVTLSGSLLAGQTYQIGNSSADPAITGISNITSAVTFYNGDDAIVLSKGGVELDIIGIVGIDPGSNWSVGTGATNEYTLVRKAVVQAGTDDWSVGQTQWDVYPQNTFSFYGNHTMDACEASPTCDAAIAPIGLASAISAPGVNLTWDPLPGAVKCEVNGRPVGASSFAKIRVDVPPYEAFVTSASLNPGTTYEWKLRCACSLSPLVVTPFSAGLETFTWPSAKLEADALAMEVFPSPADDLAQIIIISNTSQNSIINVYDFSGKLFESRSIKTVQGQNKVTLDVTDWPEGLYIINSENSDNQAVGKFIVIH